MEIVFRGAPGCFQGMEVYIGEGSRSGEPRGAHEGGGRAHPPRVRPPASWTPRGFSDFNPKSYVRFRSKKDHREGFVPFGRCLVFLFL